MYSNYPVDSRRYLRIDSKNRNRIEYPFPSDFEIFLPNTAQKTDYKNAMDPLYDGYPIEFGYFGMCKSFLNNLTVFQLGNNAFSSSNYYNQTLVVDETVCPRDYSTVITYDATPVSFGFARAVVGTPFKNPNSGQPNSLYSIRREMPVNTGSCQQAGQKQYKLTNTGIWGINITTPGSGYSGILGSSRIPVSITNSSAGVSGYGAIGYAMVADEALGTVTNIIMSNMNIFGNLNFIPNTFYNAGDVFLVQESGKYFVVINTGGTSGPAPPTSSKGVQDFTGDLTVIGLGDILPEATPYLPNTTYNLGDVIFFENIYYVVVIGPSSTTNPLTVPSFAMPINSYNPRSGYGFGDPGVIPEWEENTRVFSGDYVSYGGNIFSVYVGGITGNIPPVVTALSSPTQNGSAWLMYVSALPGLPTVFVGKQLVNFITVFPGECYVYSGLVYTCYNTTSGSGVVTQLPLTYDPLINQWKDATNSAFFVQTGTPAQGTPVYNKTAPSIPGKVWKPLSPYSTNTVIYYENFLYKVLTGGISGPYPPTTEITQDNGSLVLEKIFYKNPFEGMLFKITQTQSLDPDQTITYYSRIFSYNPCTKIITTENNIPLTGICNYEILSFSRDNANPLQYTLNPFFEQAQEMLYDISVVSLIIPNLPLFSTSGVNVLTAPQAQPFDTFPRVSTLPYVIITLKNIRNTTNASPDCSNNPNEYSATFRVAVVDNNPILSAPFTRLSGNDVKSMRFSPTDNIRITITDPEGTVLVFANPTTFREFISVLIGGNLYPDTIRYLPGSVKGLGLGLVLPPVLPLPPAPNLEISACFSVKPHAYY